VLFGMDHSFEPLLRYVHALHWDGVRIIMNPWVDQPSIGMRREEYGRMVRFAKIICCGSAENGSRVWLHIMCVPANRVQQRFSTKSQHTINVPTASPSDGEPCFGVVALSVCYLCARCNILCESSKHLDLHSSVIRESLISSPKTGQSGQR